MDNCIYAVFSDDDDDVRPTAVRRSCSPPLDYYWREFERHMLKATEYKGLKRKSRISKGQASACRTREADDAPKDEWA
jgi:hypothetical protein